MKSKIFRACVPAVFLLVYSTASISADEQYGPFNLDGGKIACNNDSGPEIKKTQVYAAPPDRFFVEGSIDVITISGWGKSSSCSIFNITKKRYYC